jgi:rubredoxin
MAHIIKINLPGGFVSAGDLYEILIITENVGAVDVRFGNRQQLFFSVNDEHLEDMETAMLQADIAYEIDEDNYPNMISSYVSDTIFSNDSWLREGVYRDIFDSFNYQPRLKINLIDRQQAFIPFFNGNFNFISSDVSNYWYLYVRFPKTSQFYCWPALIYSDDIPVISNTAETLILENKALFYDMPQVNEQLFFEMLSALTDMPPQPINAPLVLPEFYLPYYEGFNKYANNKYWLGIYRRYELFNTGFLKEICNLCIKKRIGQIYTTPWKSILIKGIDPAQRNEFGFILDKYRLNIRHASNELNWQIEDICEDGLALKKQLVREFEEADLRTFRLSFAIKTRPKTGLMGSIIIRRQSAEMFEILHTQDFNPNSKDYIIYKDKVTRSNLGPELISLCNNYYDASKNKVIALAVSNTTEEALINPEVLYQCKHCQTIYDKAYGDALNGISPGTDFADVDTSYKCPVCDAEKEDFLPLEKIKLSA